MDDTNTAVLDHSPSSPHTAQRLRQQRERLAAQRAFVEAQAEVLRRQRESIAELKAKLGLRPRATTT